MIRILFLLLLFIHKTTAEEALLPGEKEFLAEEESKKTYEIPAELRLEITKLIHESQSFLRNKKWKEAEQIGKKIEEKLPSSPEPEYIKSYAMFAAKDYANSLKTLLLGLKKSPGHDPSLFLFGLVLSRQNKWDKAAKYFEKACARADYNPFYRYNLASAYYIAGDLEKAVKESETTLRLKENYFKAKIIQIKALKGLGRKKEAYDLAKEMYDRKLELQEITPIYTSLLLETMNDPKEIIAVLSKKNQTSGTEKKMLATAYLKEGDMDKAVLNFKQSVNLDSDTEEEIFHYIYALIFSGKDAEADKIFGTLLKASPAERKSLKEKYSSILDKRNFSKGLYQPY